MGYIYPGKFRHGITVLPHWNDGEWIGELFRIRIYPGHMELNQQRLGCSGSYPVACLYFALWLCLKCKAQASNRRKPATKQQRAPNRTNKAKMQSAGRRPHWNHG